MKNTNSLYMGFQKSLRKLVEQASFYGIDDNQKIVSFILGLNMLNDFSQDLHYGNLPLTNDAIEASKIVEGFTAKIAEKPRGTWATFKCAENQNKVACVLISDGSGNAVRIEADISTYADIYFHLLSHEVSIIRRNHLECETSTFVPKHGIEHTYTKKGFIQPNIHHV